MPIRFERKTLSCQNGLSSKNLIGEAKIRVYQKYFKKKEVQISKKWNVILNFAGEKERQVQS
jgi:hypothetical protein